MCVIKINNKNNTNSFFFSLLFLLILAIIFGLKKYLIIKYIFRSIIYVITIIDKHND
jgi:hypothetical protein